MKKTFSLFLKQLQLFLLFQPKTKFNNNFIFFALKKMKENCAKNEICFPISAKRPPHAMKHENNQERKETQEH